MAGFRGDILRLLRVNVNASGSVFIDHDGATCVLDDHRDGIALQHEEALASLESGDGKQQAARTTHFCPWVCASYCAALHCAALHCTAHLPPSLPPSISSGFSPQTRLPAGLGYVFLERELNWQLAAGRWAMGGCLMKPRADGGSWLLRGLDAAAFSAVISPFADLEAPARERERESSRDDDLVRVGGKSPQLPPPDAPDSALFCPVLPPFHLIRPPPPWSSRALLARVGLASSEKGLPGGDWLASTRPSRSASLARFPTRRILPAGRTKANPPPRTHQEPPRASIARVIVRLRLFTGRPFPPICFEFHDRPFQEPLTHSRLFMSPLPPSLFMHIG
ncbi:uncharacterized protein BP5553_02197 [Venustampulla echinocandica]|uniref:Uncharacterized protein n=1 Tax=Venustampulla echinocandica TaxID=2656787 RepID=A0A370U364_9HELO|nr:uncharacterized protein BP5553_02197 [Venustampulla echinocandica]RDL42218.1 hypothetical protein BP5553_02197 [Venustampulla echinocandica]